MKVLCQCEGAGVETLAIAESKVRKARSGLRTRCIQCVRLSKGPSVAMTGCRGLTVPLPASAVIAGGHAAPPWQETTAPRTVRELVVATLGAASTQPPGKWCYSVEQDVVWPFQVSRGDGGRVLAASSPCRTRRTTATVRPHSPRLLPHVPSIRDVGWACNCAWASWRLCWPEERREC